MVIKRITHFGNTVTAYCSISSFNNCHLFRVVDVLEFGLFLYFVCCKYTCDCVERDTRSIKLLNKTLATIRNLQDAPVCFDGVNITAR